MSINMSLVPVPDVIEKPDFEAKYQELKDLLLSIDPAYAAVLELESEPVAKMLQMAAYRELHLIGKINDATRGNMLASAQKNDLEAIAARYDIERLTIQPAQPDAEPPLAAVMESDDALRRRVQMAFDGLNTAGSIDGYIFHALGADGRVRDADAFSPAPTEMVVTLLTHEGNGAASQPVLESVRAVFGLTPDGTAQAATPSKVRPQGDRVTVQSANIVPYTIAASLVILPGPDPVAVRTAALAAVTQYAADQHRLGADITHSGLHRALHQPGVQNVIITQPAADLVISREQAAWCTGITLSDGGVDE